MVIAELSEFLGIRTNNFAEYSGLLGCLQFALDNHHPRLRVVSDSELMVKQIQGKYQVNSPRPETPLTGGQTPHRQTRKVRDQPRPAPQKQGRRPPRQRSHGPRHEAPPRHPGTDPASRIRSHRLKATPYPQKSEAPPNPYAKADAMLRGFTKDGVIHVLGGTTLPDGIFVKIIRE